MELVAAKVAGIDVHKKQVTVHARIQGEGAARPWRQTKQFGTTTRELLELGDWLEALGVTLVVMEATGVYWKPLWNLFEGMRAFEMHLLNPHAVKAMRGRKTDASDAQRLADLAAHGLASPSFVPSRTQRELRDLTRLRAQLVGTKAQLANRLQKALEDANLKLGDVASDVLGVSGRLMLRAMVAGERDPSALAEMAQGRLRAKLPELREALNGRVGAHHRFLIGVELRLVEDVEEAIGRVEQQIDLALARLEAEQPPPAPPAPGTPEGAVALLCTIPGISETGARAVLAETGVDMSRFETAERLAAWAGLCPGNSESGGKRRSGRMREGNRMLRAVLAECAWGSIRKKGSAFGATYWRIARKRGPKRALMAVACRLIKAAWWVLTHRRPWTDRGAAPRPEARERMAKACLARLRQLGYSAQVAPINAATAPP